MNISINGKKANELVEALTMNGKQKTSGEIIQSQNKKEDHDKHYIEPLTIL